MSTQEKIKHTILHKEDKNENNNTQKSNINELETYKKKQGNMIHQK